MHKIDMIMALSVLVPLERGIPVILFAGRALLQAGPPFAAVTSNHPMQKESA
jgi:hypothetical protein